MKPDYFKEAVAIIADQNSVKVSFNVPIKDNYSSTYQVLIHESNATTINKLIEAGFSLHMTPKGLAVDKYI
jgi:hypothetical protein